MRVNQRYFILAISGAVLLSVAAYCLVHPISPRANSSHAQSDLAENLSKMAKTGGVKPAKSGDANQDKAPRVLTSGKELRASFDKFQGCYYASQTLAASKRAAQCKAFEGKPEFARAYASCLDNSVDTQNRISAAQATIAACGNASEVLNNYYNATKAAAKNGDPDAQICYVASYFLDLEQKPHYTDADAIEYKAEAPKYVADALKRGDWRIVQLLTAQHFSPTSGYFTLLDHVGEPETIYKMDKLLSLGASGEYAAELSALMDGLAQRLAPGKMAEDDAWAQQTYNEYFAGSPGLTQVPEICEPRSTQ
jgi:hypothetical protein